MSVLTRGDASVTFALLDYRGPDSEELSDGFQRAAWALSTLADVPTSFSVLVIDPSGREIVIFLEIDKGALRVRAYGPSQDEPLGEMRIAQDDGLVYGTEFD